MWVARGDALLAVAEVQERSSICHERRFSRPSVDGVGAWSAYVPPRRPARIEESEERPVVGARELSDQRTLVTS